MMDLAKLIGSLEIASEGSAELDVAIAYAVPPASLTERYTTSLDAIVALIERKLAGWLWTCGTAAAGKPYACVMSAPYPMPKRIEFDAHAEAPPLALCVAFLRALQAQQEDHIGEANSMIQQETSEDE